MTFLLQLLRYNDFLAPTIALLGNVLLLYLVLTVNKMTANQIRFVLIPSCILDMLLALTTYGLMPVSWILSYRLEASKQSRKQAGTVFPIGRGSLPSLST